MNESDFFDCPMHTKNNTKISELTCAGRIKKNEKRTASGWRIIDKHDYKCPVCPKYKKIQGAK